MCAVIGLIVSYKHLLSRRQKGQASVDIVASLIMFSIMLASLVSISLFLYLNHAFATAAAIGGRVASSDVNIGNPTTFATGEANVKSQVKDFIKSASGIELENNQISVTAPTGAIGNRQVKVSITHNVDSPIKVQSMMSQMAHPGQPPPEGADKFTISSAATFHYED